jgi:hypothetical protein
MNAMKRWFALGVEKQKPGVVDWYQTNKTTEPMMLWDEAVRERVSQESVDMRVDRSDIYRLIWCFTLVDLGGKILSTDSSEYSGVSTACVLYKVSLVTGLFPWDLLIVQSLELADKADEIKTMYEWSKANGLFIL